MGGARSRAQDPRLAALVFDLEQVEAVAKRYPTLQWNPDDDDLSVLVHSTVNALKNQIAVIEHNHAGAELRRQFQMRRPRGRLDKAAARVSFAEGCSTIPRSFERLDPGRDHPRVLESGRPTQMPVPARSCADKGSRQDAERVKLCALAHVGCGAALALDEFEAPMLSIGLEKL